MPWVREGCLPVLIALAGCDDPGPRPDDDYGSGYACSYDRESTMTLARPAEPPVELRIESCRRDVDACPELCRYLVRDVPLWMAPYEDCRVVFRDEQVHIQFTYVECP